ncbi:MAG: hypothetical protein AUJ97_00930 [Bacteroidetes bacterium CG2_30_32_10]|nr:MAG: hypothetical protein AUJ97_00930 [Bacteroidetes bacterium CG2_30_32_10]
MLGYINKHSCWWQGFGLIKWRLIKTKCLIMINFLRKFGIISDDSYYLYMLLTNINHLQKGIATSPC